MMYNIKSIYKRIHDKLNLWIRFKKMRMKPHGRCHGISDWIFQTFDNLFYTFLIQGFQSTYVKDWNTYYNGFLRADQSMAKHCCRMGWIGCPTLLTDEKQSWDFNILHIFAILALKRYGKILSNVGKTFFCSVLYSNCLFQCIRSG